MNQTALTEQILEYRRNDDTFRKSLKERSAQRSFRFYDGPPFTSGDPHYGHLLQSTVKDMVPRWMTMRGYRVDRKRGWDCHGIPAENFVNKQLGITTKKQVEAEYGVGPYVEECRKMVNQVNDNRKWFVDHVGRWVDMDNAYFTMDNDFMESVIWVFSDLYSKNLIYKGFKVLGYSRALGTALSASEIAEGYEDRQDPAVTVRFKLSSPSSAEFVSTQDGYIDVVCGIIKNSEGKVLKMYFGAWNKWYLPGGKVDKGETTEQALKRELKEELGVDVIDQTYIGAYKSFHQQKLWKMHYFEVKIEGEPVFQEHEKKPDVSLGWVDIYDVDTDLGFGIRVNGLIIEDEEQMMNECIDMYLVKKGIVQIPELADAPVYMLARTTTPRTLPSNMFLAVNSKLVYIQIYDKIAQCYYILAKNLLGKYYKNPEEYVVVCTFKGKELLGLRYQPIFDYIEKKKGHHKIGPRYHPETEELIEGSETIYYYKSEYMNKIFQVLDADFVTDDAGTGIAHEAPAFGELDYNLVAGFLGRDTAHEWLFNPVDDNGEFTAEVPEWEGMNVITASTEITKFLKHRGDIIKHETLNHSYPHCPRTGTPLIYRAMESWFVKEDQLKAESVPLAETINFVPPSVKNRFIEGLKSAPDWNISRSRYWGAPLPVWVAEPSPHPLPTTSLGEGTPLVLGSREEIYEWSKTGSKNVSKFVIVRHGESLTNVLYRNDPTATFEGINYLSELGNIQAQGLVQQMKDIYTDDTVILISPLMRTLQTIDPFLQEKFGISLLENKEVVEYCNDCEKNRLSIYNGAGGEITYKKIEIAKNIYIDGSIIEQFKLKKSEDISFDSPWSGNNLDHLCINEYAGKQVLLICHAGVGKRFQESLGCKNIKTLENAEFRTIYIDTNTKKELDHPEEKSRLQTEPLVLGSREEIYQWSKTGSKNVTKIILVRHGRATSNEQGFLDGKNTAQLSEVGLQQAQNLVGLLNEVQPDVIYSSPFQRCIDTIQPFANSKNIEIHEDARLREIDYGIYDQVNDGGKTIQQWGDEKKGYYLTHKHEKVGETGPESYQDFEVRIEAFWQEINLKYTGKTIVICSHGDIVWKIRAYIRGMELKKENEQKLFLTNKPGNQHFCIEYIDTNTQKSLDLHRPYIDNIRFMKDGVKYTRIPEVLDCWFESGSMPYGQEKYKGEQGTNPPPVGHLPYQGGNLDFQELTQKSSFSPGQGGYGGAEGVGTQGTFNPTANFIAEGLDQTRGWFRSLHVLGTATFTKPIFENVVVTGMILAEDGKKMSKSKKNFPDPKILLEQYGPDAFRLYMLASPVVRSEPLRFKEKDVEQVLKDVLLPLHNVVNFLSTYAKVDEWKHSGTEIYFMRHADAMSALIETTDHNGDVIVEDVRTKETPLSEKGEAQLLTEQFIEEVGRVMPDIILCSDLLRAQQTAAGAQKILKVIYGKEVEIVSSEKYAKGMRPDTVADIYTEIQTIYTGKKVLLVSHNRRFLMLWNHLMGTTMEKEILEEKKHIGATQIIRLPLVKLENEMDQWMYSELYTLIEKITTELTGYRLDSATVLLSGFVEKITNWYLRRSRRRFRANGMDADKIAAYTTLHEVMSIYMKLLAPFAPFTTEFLWKGLQDFCKNSKNQSIHLEYRPLQGSQYINAELMEEIATVRTIIKQALFVRAKNQIKVKIPLRKMEVKIS